MNIIDKTKRDFVDKYLKIDGELISFIKKSFIWYYGKDFEYKINKLFSNLRIVFMTDNIDQISINNSIKYFLEQNDKNETLDDLELLNLGYYGCIKDKKKNEENKKIILLHNNICDGYCKFDEYVEKKLTSNGCSISDERFPVIYINVEQNGMFQLQGLIHEINHALMKEELAIDSDNNYYYLSGIYENSSEKMFNELINEYITGRIMDNTMNEIDGKFNFVKCDYESWYIDLDRLNDNLICQIFVLFEDLIKNSIITGKTLLTKKILNDNREKIFDYINNTYSKMLKELYVPGRRKEVILETYKKIDIESIKERNKKILEIVKKSYSNYLTYTKNINDYVNETIKNGTAVSLK